jgi:hypothetical protein
MIGTFKELIIMFDRLLNAKIVSLQKFLSGLYGWDSAIVVNEVRRLTQEAKESRNLSIFDEYMKEARS